MLGLQRGHIYYNLMNWYRALGAVPLPESMRDKMMDDMMGVKQGMGDELTALVGTARETVPDYGTGDRVGLLGRLFSSWLHMDEVVVEFLNYFETWYEHWRRRDFREMTMHELVAFYHGVVRDIIEEWDVPPANDTLVMAFFGSLKKATMALPGMDGDEDKATELMNQLLQGQDVKSFKPTEHLMALAAQIDASDAKEWFVQTDSKDIAARIMNTSANANANANAIADAAQETILQGVRDWVDKWGFRCACELKLEENDYFDDPTFLVDQLQGYLRSGKFDVNVIKEREKTTKAAAESRLATLLSGAGCVGRAKYYWILKNARRHVTHRENLRFARTQLWGILRKLFRGFGAQMFRFEVLASPKDIFYLTCDEIVAFVEGRGVTRDVQAIVDARKTEFEEYRAAPEPPERFLTFGPQGAMMKFPLVLTDLDLLKDLNAAASSDPNVLTGKPCCPGVVEKVVRVVKDVRECAGMNGEILVTARTDPGWVTVYPMLGGILIERGSLLSHSAVVAREVGLPAIVSIAGGLTSRLKTGMLVRMDGAAGTVTILTDENGVPVEAVGEEGAGEEEKSAAAEIKVDVAAEDEDPEEAVAPPKKGCIATACSCFKSLICGSILFPFALLGCLYTCACGACMFTRTSPKRWEPVEVDSAADSSTNNKMAVATTSSSTGEGKESSGGGATKETEMVKIRVTTTSSSSSFKTLVRAAYDDPAPNSLGAWYKFFMERIPVVVYGLLTGGMVLSGSYTSAEKFDAFGFWVGFAIGMLFLVLLRFMDEAKDIEKDKVGHPERPLPRGLVSLAAVTRAIYFMSLLLLGVSIACFWINIASGVSALIVTFVLGLMYAEFFCEDTLDNSPLLVAITHQSIIFPLSVFVCCVNNANAWNESRTYFFACVMLGSMLVSEGRSFGLDFCSVWSMIRPFLIRPFFVCFFLLTASDVASIVFVSFSLTSSLTPTQMLTPARRRTRFAASWTQKRTRFSAPI
jgi:phosphohistidine swiveling domain-containing protein